MGKLTIFLLTPGPARVSLAKKYMMTPEPKPPIQHTNVRFQIANGSVNRAAGVCHLPLQLRFSNIVKSLCLPVFHM